MIQRGAQDDIFGAHVVAVAWDAADGDIWTRLHAVDTDMPLYRVCPDGVLERCVVTEHGAYQGWRCDGTTADVRPWSGTGAAP